MRHSILITTSAILACCGIGAIGAEKEVAKFEQAVLKGLPDNTWDRSEKHYNDVWVLETKSGRWTEIKSADPAPQVQTRECRQCVYDPNNNVVLLLTNRGSLWAYRHRN